MSARWWPTSLTVGCTLLACSDWGWTRVAKAYPDFELRAVIEQPDVFAAYSIDPESGAAATRSCPDVAIGKERVGAPGAGRDLSYAYSEDEAALRACANGAETADTQILLGRSENGAKISFRTYGVSRAPFLTGADIARARVTQDHGDFWVRLELTPRGRAVLGSFSASHVDGRMAIVLDARVAAAPRISSPVGGQIVSLFVPDKVAGEALLRKLTGT